MGEYIWIILIPIAWYFIMISYQALRLLKLWLEFKLDNIKNKEYSLWD